MSHFVTIETQIRDIAALRDACEKLGLELLHEAEARGYANQTRQAEYVIRLKGSYDIAVNCPENGGGKWELTTDWWDGHVEKDVGANYGRLLQLYGAHKTLREARRVTRHQYEDGSIRLTLAA